MAVIILLAMITVHEFGHFLTGRILGFKITEFSIGFGPAVFKRVSKKTGIAFCLRAFPLGGFCAFAGEDGEEEDGKDKEDFDGGGIKPVDAGDISAGDIKSATAGQTGGDVIPGGAEKPTERVLEPQGRDFIDQPPWKRIIVLVAGAFFNYALALILIIIGAFSFGQPSYKLLSVEPDPAYAAYSFEEGDVILGAEGRTVYLATDLIAALNGKSEGDIGGFTVLRDGEEREIEVAMRSDCNFKNSSEVSKIWRALGAGTYERPDGLYWNVTAQNCRFPFWQTVGRSFGYSFRMAGSIFKVLGELLTGNLGLNAMGGPVTTIKVTGEMAVQGVQSFLQVAAYIGVNLAVFNLLPIPALDGSKVVFCLIEWIFRKPVPRKVEAIIHAVGFVLILGFAVLVDVLQFARC